VTSVECGWSRACELAAGVGAASVVAPMVVPLASAAGGILAENACARGDLPPADVSAMDGWAVAGPPPWRVVGEVLAGSRWPSSRPLAPGEAVGIATGAGLPAGADAVLRRERGRPDGDRLVAGGLPPDAGTDVRSAGQECRRGDVVLEAGTEIGAAALGLLAAAGLDRVAVRRVRADVLVLGDELLTSGPGRDGRLRDALGPLLSVWLPGRGIEIASRRYVPDAAGPLATALSGSLGDVVVTTGSTARGPVDFLHAVLASAGARLVVDGVAVRPGHPQLLAVLADGRPLVGLPGNPLAAVSGLLTLFDPMVASMRGRPPVAARRGVLAVDVPAGPDATRLVPVAGGRPALFAGPGMLRGLAGADAVAVVPPGGIRAGEPAVLLDLP
jgi:molybdopterin molybdotransferase